MNLKRKKKNKSSLKIIKIFQKTKIAIYLLYFLGMSPTETLEKNIKVRTKKNKTFKKKINKFTLFNLFIIINKGLF